MEKFWQTFFRRNNSAKLHPEIEWAVWYQDTFDRDAPDSIDISGTGLIKGLTELWARHFFETTRADGKRGFSVFYLQLKQQSISIEGNEEGSKRIRAWLFGEKDHTVQGYVAEANPELLNQLAYTHACLIDKENIAAKIIAIAALSEDRNDFIHRLNKLIKES